MVRGVNKYISKNLAVVIEKEQKKMKYNKRIKGSHSFVKACDIVARRLRR